MIDFRKLSAQIQSGNTINPSEMFLALPSKAEKYSYLRNVQSEVLDQWFDIRNKKDTIIKMNTGSGKTTVALLILKSCLAEKGGHAAYVVPDNYLVNQVIREANDLGIQVTTSEKDINFLTGEAILVINIQKLFNGKSVFGMRTNGNIPIDYILIDDVHACVDDVKSQFSIKLPADSDIAKEIFSLYKDDLKAQNEKAFLDICDEDATSGYLCVPFWRIYDTRSQLLKTLQKYKNDDLIKFNFPLIGDTLQFCNCTFSYKGIEIEPYSIPIHKITAFANAERRIFMSATLCDDSQLLSAFDITQDVEVITPKYAADIGDRMILFPQAYSPQITDEAIKEKLVEYASKINIVVIVPSNYRASFWRDCTDKIFTAINLVDGIQIIRSSDNGLYVFVNKYDGIDLPDNACRIIVLDGLPDARSAFDKISENYLFESISGIKSKIQKIEQGMGRGIRSNKDYCGVILMGAPLVDTLYSKNASQYFSAATQKQYEISSILARDLKNEGVDVFFSTLDYCISQQEEWVKLSKGALSSLVYEKQLKIDEVTSVLRLAYDQAVLYSRYDIAKKVVCDLVNNTEEPIYKGYLMLEEAKYCQFVDPVEAQKILTAAQKFNHHLLKPLNGIKTYDDLRKIKPQSMQIIETYAGKDVNEYIVKLNAVIESLIFAPASYKAFENAFMNLGILLGFGASRPDDEYDIGPDVLWYLGNMQYVVIECKNEATSSKISKSYCEQLLSSISWFETEFPTDSTRIPIMVYPTAVFDKHASPNDDFRIIDNGVLDNLKSKLRDYCKTISTNGAFQDIHKLSAALDAFSLTPEKFANTYSIPFQRES